MPSLVDILPHVRGRYQPCVPLGPLTWMRVGGPAGVLFTPADLEDLCCFLRDKPEEVPVNVLGCGSNVIIRDGGVPGVVIRLRRGFHGISIEGTEVRVGAGALDSTVAHSCAQAGVGGLEFFATIPGTIGGALKMNAGAYNVETQDLLRQAKVVDPQGNIHLLAPKELGYSYRKCSLPTGWIFVEGLFEGVPSSPVVIAEKIHKMIQHRNRTQPIHARTAGSTFVNPKGYAAWQLIEEAGCRGLSNGYAEISHKHANFIININNASAFHVESLGEEVRHRVAENSGVWLEWEVHRMGEKKPCETETEAPFLNMACSF